MKPERSSIPLFVAPTSVEYAAVRKALKPALAAQRVHLVQCGVGEKNAAEFCRHLHPAEISYLVLLGWAGGLVSELPVGAVIFADTALREGRQPLSCLTLPVVGSLTGPILTSPIVLNTPAEKYAAVAGGALAVEMEAYSLAAWAVENHILFVHGRLILDSVEETLPDTGSFQDETGRIRLGSLLKNMAARPALFLSLARLFRRVRKLDPFLEKLAADSLQAISTFSG